MQKCIGIERFTSISEILAFPIRFQLSLFMKTIVGCLAGDFHVKETLLSRINLFCQRLISR